MNLLPTRPPEIVVILDDEQAIAEGLAGLLEHDGRRIIICREAEAVELLLERFDVQTLISDVRLTGRFAFEGLDLVRYVRKHSPQTRIVVMSGDEDESIGREALRRGAGAFLRKPFAAEALDAALRKGGAQ